MENPRIGYSKRIITPPLGTLLAGYDYERHAEGVHDDLYARVVVIEKDELFVFVQLDLLGIDRYFVNLIGNNLQEMYGVNKDNVLVSCIHTHSGPRGLTRRGVSKSSLDMSSSFDNALFDYIMKQIALAFKEALGDLDAFSLSYRNSKVRGIGLNRRSPSLPIDDNLQVLLFTREDNKKIVLYNYACHPTVMNRFNMQITADYPGESSRFLESRGDIVCALFYNGACGDVSTRFTRMESSFSEVERIGDILGSGVLKLVSQGGIDEDIQKIRVKSIQVELKVKKLMKTEEAKEAIEKAKAEFEEAKNKCLNGGEIRVYQTIYEGALQNFKLIESLGSLETIDIEIKILQINERYIVYIPGELFTNLGIMLKEKCGKNNIIISCYSNGYSGYIPDIEAYNQDGYETLSSKFAAGEGEKLVNKIICLIESMREE